MLLITTAGAPGAGGSVDTGPIAVRGQRNKDLSEDNDSSLPSAVPTAAGSFGRGTAAGMGAAAAVVTPPLNYQGVTVAGAAAKGDLPHVALL